MTSWTVRVDWLHHPGGEDVEQLEQILEDLTGFHPAINIEPNPLPEHGHRASATLTLEAGSLRQASAAALQAVESAVGHKAIGLEVLTTDEFDRELARPQIPGLVGNADIAEILGVSRQRAAQLADADGFPPAVAHIKAGPLRVRRQVEQWAQTWPRKGGRQPKTAPQ